MPIAPIPVNIGKIHGDAAAYAEDNGKSRWHKDPVVVWKHVPAPLILAVPMTVLWFFLKFS
jgi:hypothetical protein